MRDSFLASNIGVLRNIFNETQAELASKIGVTPPAVAAYEKAERIPKPEILEKIARHYRHTLDEMLYIDFSLVYTHYGESVYKRINPIIDKVFPLAVSKEALKNKSFKKGYEINLQIFDDLKNYHDVSDKLYEMESKYIKAGKEQVIESSINMIWAILLTWDDIVLQNSLDFKDLDVFIKKGILRDETNNSYEEAKRCSKYLNDNEGYVIDVLNVMREYGYIELSEYYSALCYQHGMIRSIYNVDMLATIGREMMRCLDRIGNPYAQNLLEAYNSLYKKHK